MEALYMPIKGLTDKEPVLYAFAYINTHIHIHKMGYYSTMKKDVILPFATT